ncbi:MAG: ABC transporter permease [Firmicutes bacterium]|nr:ABC transporter permease [Bacillota bacterium]
MLLRNIYYFISEAIKGLFRNGWMSLASIGVVAIALLIFGIFVLLNMNVEHWSGTLLEQIEIVVFIDDDASALERRNLKNSLDEHELIREADYVTKEVALEELKDMLGPEYVEGIEENPLQDSYIIRVWKPEMVSALIKDLEKISAIEDIVCHQEMVEKLTKFTRALQYAALTLMILLAVTATFLISHSIRMTVMLRSEEIMIMKYVGATDSFIRLPFVFEGLFLGLLGTIIPLICLYFGYQLLLEGIETELAFLPMVPFHTAMNEVARLVFPMGIGLGIVGSVLSIRRYLKV